MIIPHSLLSSMGLSIMVGPSVISWFVNLMNSIGESVINHTCWTYVHQLSYRKRVLHFLYLYIIPQYIVEYHLLSYVAMNIQKWDQIGGCKFVSFSPPARWGCCLILSELFSSSSASSPAASSSQSRSQWAQPDLHRELQIPVGTAGPQPRVADRSGHCRTSTATSRSQWALPDLNRDFHIRRYAR